MKHDPKHASDDAFEDQPTGKWRTVGTTPVPELESDPAEAELGPEQLVELAN